MPGDLASLPPVAPNVMLVVDRSGSMAPHWESLLQLTPYVEAMGDLTRTGLALFPDQHGSSSVEESISVPVAAGTASEIMDTLAESWAAGRTPMTAVLARIQAHGRLQDPYRENVVVLVSDGAPNCGGSSSSAVSAVTDMVTPEEPVKMHFIGFAASAAANQTLEEMGEAAEVTTGEGMVPPGSPLEATANVAGVFESRVCSVRVGEWTPNARPDEGSAPMTRLANVLLLGVALALVACSESEKVVSGPVDEPVDEPEGESARVCAPEAVRLDCVDEDANGICLPWDNCPEQANTDQLDTDDDGVGDSCDACPFDPNEDPCPEWCGDFPEGTVVLPGYSLSVFADGLDTPSALATLPGGGLIVGAGAGTWNAVPVVHLDASGTEQVWSTSVDDPDGVDLDSSGRVYVAGSSRVSRALSVGDLGSGSEWSTWYQTGGNLNDIVIDTWRGDIVYVAQDGGSVQMLDPTAGDLELETITSFGDQPSIALHSDTGNLWVILANDNLLYEVDPFTGDTELRADWSSDHGIVRTNMIAWDEDGQHLYGSVYTLDGVPIDGAHIGRWDPAEPEAMEYLVEGIHLTDPKNNAIDVAVGAVCTWFSSPLSGKVHQVCQCP